MVDLFDESEKEIKFIPRYVSGDQFIAEVADIERKVILETRLAADAIRQFPADLYAKAEGIIGEFAVTPGSRRPCFDGFDRRDWLTRREIADKVHRAHEYALRERKSIVIGLLREVFRELTKRKIETPFGILEGDPRQIRQLKARFYKGKKGRRR